MNAHAPEFLIGLLIGGLVAGAVCGLLPLSLGLKRQRLDLALPAMIVCVLCGLIGGLILAVPAAIVWTVIITAVARPKESRFREPEMFLSGPLDWNSLDPDAPPPLPRSEPVLMPAARPRRPAQDEARLSFGCPTCGKRVFPDVDRVPPWCPACGTDLKALAESVTVGR